MKREEQQLQIACVEWAAVARLPINAGFIDAWHEEERRAVVGDYVYHVGNGGGRSKAEGGIFKAMGVRPGVPDLCLCLPCWWPGPKWSTPDWRACAGLYIELKAGSGSTSAQQNIWLSRLERVGYETAVVRDLGAFIAVVEVYLGCAYPLSHGAPETASCSSTST